MSETEQSGEGGDGQLPRYRDASRRGLQRRTSVIFLVAATLLVAAVVVTVGTISVARHDRDRLVNRLDPALLGSGSYLSALLDEASGARTYALTGSPAYHTLYVQGVARAAVAEAQLSAYLPTPAERRTLAGLLDAVHVWTTTLVAPLAVGPAAKVAAVDPTKLAASNVQLTAIRADLRQLNNELLASRRSTVRGFDDSLSIVESIVIAFGAAMVLLLVGLVLALRREVLSPLVRLGSASRRVASGDLDHPVPLAGPPEVVDLGRDIEAMRARVVAELRASEAAHDEVVRQGHILEQRDVELTRSNRDLEQFAYVASHDLQEPLRKVASFCQLLSERYHEQLDDRGQQYIDFAVDGSKRMQALVNDLLAFSRVGRTSAGWSEVDLGEAVRQACANLQTRIDEAGGTVDADPDLPVVIGDRTLLVTLLQNLIGNGIKFHGDEPPLVTISGRRDGASWVLRVADNGIEPRFAERVFVIFQRLHARDRYDGTGIGLALSRRIVEFHGGTIRIVDDDRPGTTFELTLPVDPAAPPMSHDEETAR